MPFEDNVEVFKIDLDVEDDDNDDDFDFVDDLDSPFMQLLQNTLMFGWHKTSFALRLMPIHIRCTRLPQLPQFVVDSFEMFDGGQSSRWQPLSSAIVFGAVVNSSQ